MAHGLLKKDFLNIFDHFTARGMAKDFKTEKKGPGRHLKFGDENAEQTVLLPEERLWSEVVNQTFRDLSLVVNSLNQAYAYNLRCKAEQHISVRSVAERYKYEILPTRREGIQDSEIATLRLFVKDFGSRKITSLTNTELKAFELKATGGTKRVDICQRIMRPISDIFRKSTSKQWGYIKEINYNFYIHEITAITHSLQSEWMKHICDFIGKPHDRLPGAAYNGVTIFNEYIQQHERLLGLKDIDSRVFDGVNFIMYDGVGKQTRRRRFEEGKA